MKERSAVNKMQYIRTQVKQGRQGQQDASYNRIVGREGPATTVLIHLAELPPLKVPKCEIFDPFIYTNKSYMGR